MCGIDRRELEDRYEAFDREEGERVHMREMLAYLVLETGMVRKMETIILWKRGGGCASGSPCTHKRRSRPPTLPLLGEFMAVLRKRLAGTMGKLSLAFMTSEEALGDSGLVGGRVPPVHREEAYTCGQAVAQDDAASPREQTLRRAVLAWQRRLKKRNSRLRCHEFAVRVQDRPTLCTTPWRVGSAGRPWACRPASRTRAATTWSCTTFRRKTGVALLVERNVQLHHVHAVPAGASLWV